MKKKRFSEEQIAFALRQAESGTTMDIGPPISNTPDSIAIDVRAGKAAVGGRCGAVSRGEKQPLEPATSGFLFVKINRLSACTTQPQIRRENLFVKRLVGASKDLERGILTGGAVGCSPRTRVVTKSELGAAWKRSSI